MENKIHIKVSLEEKEMKNSILNGDIQRIKNIQQKTNYEFIIILRAVISHLLQLKNIKNLIKIFNILPELYQLTKNSINHNDHDLLLDSMKKNLPTTSNDPISDKQIEDQVKEFKNCLSLIMQKESPENVNDEPEKTEDIITDFKLKELYPNIDVQGKTIQESAYKKPKMNF